MEETMLAGDPMVEDAESDFINEKMKIPAIVLFE